MSGSIELHPGQYAGPYLVVERLHTGLRGQLFKAFDPRGRTVHIRTPAPALRRDSGGSERFELQAAAVESLGLPSLLPVLAQGLLAPQPEVPARQDLGALEPAPEPASAPLAQPLPFHVLGRPDGLERLSQLAAARSAAFTTDDLAPLLLAVAAAMDAARTHGFVCWDVCEVGLFVRVRGDGTWTPADLRILCSLDRRADDSPGGPDHEALLGLAQRLLHLDAAPRGLMDGAPRGSDGSCTELAHALLRQLLGGSPETAREPPPAQGGPAPPSPSVNGVPGAPQAMVEIPVVGEPAGTEVRTLGGLLLATAGGAVTLPANSGPVELVAQRDGYAPLRVTLDPARHRYLVFQLRRAAP
jgi:hypothetical protein